jgi:hypothetical protein
MSLERLDYDQVAMEFSIELGKEVLRNTPNVLLAMLPELSNDWTLANEGPGTWSPCQVVGHLTHIEEVDWIDRTRLILEHGTNKTFEPLDCEAGFARFQGVAEAYTKRPGAFVPRLETIAAFRALLSGAYDGFPEEAFLMRGTLDVG